MQEASGQNGTDKEVADEVMEKEVEQEAAGGLGGVAFRFKKTERKTLIYQIISVWFPLQLFFWRERQGLLYLTTTTTRASVIFEGKSFLRL